MDGIAGVYGHGNPDLVDMIFLATGQCQHRGKSSAGIAVGNGDGIFIYNNLGRIGDVITPDIIKPYKALHPIAAIGNVGYTKKKIPEKINAEPIEIHPKKDSRYQVVLTMDGYLLFEDDLKSDLSANYRFNTGNKTEIIGALLHQCIDKAGVTFEAGKDFLEYEKLIGRATFALVALIYDSNKKETYMITLNDSKAFEPFCFGTIDDMFVVSSESCSHRRLGGFIEREYDGAEMTICSPNGIEMKRLRHEKLMRDIFQKIYYGNAGSICGGEEIFETRRRLGWGSIKYYGIPNADIYIANPESGWGFAIGVFEEVISQLEKIALDYSIYEKEGMIIVKDKKAHEKLMSLKTVYPALIKQSQAVRTFQEGERITQLLLTGLKYGVIESLIRGKDVEEKDDSTVKGTVGEGGAFWVLFNAGAKSVTHRTSYPPMFFPTFKEWPNGPECLDSLAVQRAFRSNKTTPYGRSIEEINDVVARMFIQKLEEQGIKDCNLLVRYNPADVVKGICGLGSYQALDASYPIDERFWPDWIKKEVELFNKLT